jgi:hypothetical protein
MTKSPALASLFGIDRYPTGEATPGARVSSTAAFSRNPFFTGREDQLKGIHGYGTDLYDFGPRLLKVPQHIRFRDRYLFALFNKRMRLSAIIGKPINDFRKHKYSKNVEVAHYYMNRCHTPYRSTHPAIVNSKILGAETLDDSFRSTSIDGH